MTRTCEWLNRAGDGKKESISDGCVSPVRWVFVSVVGRRESKVDHRVDQGFVSGDSTADQPRQPRAAMTRTCEWLIRAGVEKGWVVFGVDPHRADLG